MKAKEVVKLLMLSTAAMLVTSCGEAEAPKEEVKETAQEKKEEKPAVVLKDEKSEKPAMVEAEKAVEEAQAESEAETEAEAVEAESEQKAETPDAIEYMTMYATAKTNVREEANEKAKKLGSVAKGEAVEVVKGTEIGEWASIRYKDVNAYMISKNLSADKPVEAKASEEKKTEKKADATEPVVNGEQKSEAPVEQAQPVAEAPVETPAETSSGGSPIPGVSKETYEKAKEAGYEDMTMQWIIDMGGTVEDSLANMERAAAAWKKGGFSG